MKKLFARRESITFLLVILAFILGFIESPKFLDVHFLLDSSSPYVETGLLALGMTLVIVSGQIDLSVGSTLALTACVVGKLLEAHWSVPSTIAVGLLIGAVLGAINGLLVAKLKLPSFVVTLATMAGYRGLAQVLMGASSATIPPSMAGADMANFPGLPIPLPLGLFIIVAILMGLLLHRTVLGRWIVAVGTNAKASTYSGVPTDRVTILVFAITGLLSGFAGILMDSRLEVARFDHGHGLELDAITVVVLGGASISGGSGSILGTVLALSLIGAIRTGMLLQNVTAEYQLAAVGTLLVLAVIASNLTERISSRRRTTIKPNAARLPRAQEAQQ